MRKVQELGYKWRNVLVARGLHVSRASPDSSLTVFLMTLVREFQINFVIDVGAASGEFGAKLRNAGYRGRIASFEPRSEGFASLRDRASGDSGWDCYQMALGNEEGDKQLNVAGGDAWSSSFLVANERGVALPVMSNVLHPAVVSSETVPVSRFDAIADEVLEREPRPRILFKTDAQGYDVEVLKGATHTLTRCVALQSEASFLPIYEGALDYQAFISFVSSSGFELSAVFPVFRDSGMRLVEADLVFVRSPDFRTS